MLTPCLHAFCLQLVMEVMKKLEGAYALLIKSRHYPGEMVAAKRGSPMIVGIKEGQGKKSGGGLTHRCVRAHAQVLCSFVSLACALLERKQGQLFLGHGVHMFAGQVHCCMLLT